MSATDALYSVLQSGANLNLTNAQAQDTQALAQIRLYGLMQNIQTQQIMRDYYAKQQAVQNNPTGPGTAPPPGLAPGDQSPFGNNGILSPMVQEVQTLQRQANQWTDLGNMLVVVNPEEGRKWQDMAAKVREQATQKNLEITQKALEFDKHVGGLAGAAADAANNGNQAAMLNSWQQMIAMQPAMRGIQLQTDAKGMPLANDVNAKVFNNVALSKMSAGEQVTEGLRKATLQETIARNAASEDIRRQNLLIEQQRADQAALAHRDQVEHQQEQLYQRQVGQAQQISTAYENQSNKFKDVVMPMQTATAYLIDPKASAEQGKPVMKPNTAFNPAGDRMFAEQYIKLTYPEYRGSVYDQKTLAALPGIPTRIVQGIKNAVQGYGIDRDTKADMYGAMQQAFKPLNEAQMQREDSATAKAINANIPSSLADIYINKYALRPSAPRTNPASAAAAQNSQSGGLPRVSSQAEYDKLQPGQQYIAPDGRTGIKQ